MNTDAQTSSLKQQLVATWLHHDNAWMDSASVTGFFPDLPKQKIYAQVSEWSAVGVLERRKRTKGTGYEYKLHDPNSFLVSAVDETAHAKAVATATATYEKHAPSMPKLTVVPEGTKGRKPSVVWKQEEKGLLAEEVHRLRLNRPHPKLIDLLNEVQHILPQNRRRHIRGLSETPWFEPLLQQIAARKVEVKPEPVITEPVQEYTAAPEPVSVSDITTGALIDEVVKRMGGIIRELLVSVLSSPEVKKLLHPPTTHQHVTGKNEVMQRHNPNPRSEDKVKLRRIVILGLNKTHQQEELRQEFNGAFDFRFVHSDANFHQLKTICAGADNTIVMTDKVSHKHSDCLKGASLPFLPLAGNIGVLKDKLTDLYANS